MRKVTGIVIAVLIAVLLAACGSSTGSSSAQGAGAPINVGEICSCAAPGSTGFPIMKVFDAWVKATNAAGGIEGHKINLIYKDDTPSAADSISDINTLISDHVVAIVDMSEYDSTWEAAVKTADIPVVGSVSNTNAPFNTNSDFYPVTQTADSEWYSGVAMAKEAGAKIFGNVYCAEFLECDQSVAGFKTSTAQLGLTDAYNASVSLTSPNYTAQCLAAQSLHVQAIYPAAIQPEIIRLANDCSAQGYDPIYVQGLTQITKQMMDTKSLNNSMWLASPALPYYSNTPAVHAMNAAVDKYDPGLRSDATVWDQFAENGWLSGLLLHDALIAGGLTRSSTASAASVVKGLTSLHGDTLDGMAPPLTFKAGHVHPVDCWFPLRLEHGKFVTLNGGKSVCGS